MIAHALRYAALGWRVLPLFEPVGPGVCSCWKGAACDRTGKHPRVGGWPLVAPDEANIRSWWRKWPRANIGIAMGRGLLAVDVDGPVGEAAWLKLVAGREIPATSEASTGGGGRHLIFAVEGQVRTSAKTLAPSVDTRGEGGQIVVAPSVHSSGRRYAWTVAPWDCAPARAPAWLLERLDASARLAAAAPRHDGESAARREGRVRGGPDSSDSGQDASAVLGLIRRGASDEQIADWLRKQASYLKRLARGERLAEEYLQRTIAWARSQPVVDPWSGSRRVTIMDAEFERLPARPTGLAAADRVKLWLAADDGEVFPRQSVYLHARDVYTAVLGDIPPAAWLESKDSGTALAQTLVGRELEIVIPPGKTRASRMRRVGGHRP